MNNCCDTLYGNYRTRTFNDIYENIDKFSADFDFYSRIIKSTSKRWNATFYSIKFF